MGSRSGASRRSGLSGAVGSGSRKCTTRTRVGQACTRSCVVVAKVAVGDVVEIDKVADEAGSSIELTPLLVVDGESVTSDKDALGKVKVTAEVLGETKGPKIRILKYKNKTGYKKRQGHRQKYTQVKVTGIEG